MDINDAMRIRRCINALASGGKTLEELAVALDSAETLDRFEAFVLTLVVANLIGHDGKHYVLSSEFLDIATAQFAEVYGGKTVYVRKRGDLNPGEILSALCGGGK